MKTKIKNVKKSPSARRIERLVQKLKAGNARLDGKPLFAEKGTATLRPEVQAAARFAFDLGISDYRIRPTKGGTQ